MSRAAKPEEYLGTVDIAAIAAIWKNLKEFPKALSWSAAMSGLLIVLISSTGPTSKQPRCGLPIGEMSSLRGL